MKKILKVTGKVLLGVLALALLVAVFVAFAPPKKYDIEVADFEISSDPEIISRGEYLAFGPAHCAECHSPPETKFEDYANRPSLTGGRVFDLPFGSIVAKNITPDAETGIGGMSNADIERTIRYSVNRHGNNIMPFMNFTHMSKEDVLAVISFLRSQPEVRNEVPNSSYNILGKGLMRFVLKPLEATEPILEQTEDEISIANGSYVINNIGNCNGCHTPFDMGSMSWDESKHLSGGDEIIHGDLVFYPPNLTPDETTGHIKDWTEERFVARFKNGRLIPDSPMAWEQFSEISENDLRSMYRYLKTVQPVEHNTNPVVRLISELED